MSAATPVKEHRGSTNLRPPWQPGCPSPNPNGRPHKKLVVEYLEEELEELAKTQGIECGTRLAAKKWAAMIFNGDRGAWAEYLERRDGKVKEQIEMQVGVDVMISNAYERWLKRDEPPAELEAHVDE